MPVDVAYFLRGLFPPWLRAFTPSLEQSWEMQKRQVHGGWLVSIYITWGFSVLLPLPPRSWDLTGPGQVHLSDGCARQAGPLEFGAHPPRGLPDARGRASETGSLGVVALGKRSEHRNDKTSLEVGVRTE